MWKRLCPVFALFLAFCSQARSDPDSTFLLSFFSPPPAAETTLERYREIADCGFTVVMAGGEPVFNAKILDLCRQTGLKAMLQDSRILDKEPDDPDFTKNLDAIVADYSQHPSLYGYYLDDEPAQSAFAKLGAINQYLLKKDPKHTPYINLFPNYCPAHRLGSRDYDDHVTNFIEMVRPALVSWDHYALKRDGLRSMYFANMELVRKKCLKANLPYTQVILSVPHFHYRDPNDADMRWQVYTSLCYGCKGILYFLYWAQPDYPDAPIAKDGTRNPKYDIIRRLNHKVQALAPTLMRWRSVDVYHTGPVPRGGQTLDHKAPVREAFCQKLTIGWLKDDKKNSDYIFVVNRSFQRQAEARLMLADFVTGASQGAQETGKPERVEVEDKTLEVTLEPGEGKLYLLHR